MLRRLIRRIRNRVTTSEPQVTVVDAPAPRRGGPLMNPVEPEDTVVHISAPMVNISDGVYIPIDGLPTLRETIRAAVDKHDSYFIEFAVVESDITPAALSPFCAACHERVTGDSNDAIMVQQHSGRNDIDAISLHHDCVRTLFDELDVVYEERADELLGRAL